ncbi:MAG: CDP-alcohol phosphatidyltransferase family protein, partial [Myxococcales bacterium]|nr:CDP-alcohol phosphatidyltransferase family protein [Myxococcales bacterium]
MNAALRMPPFASILKSKAVEDPVNVYVERPLAYVFAWSVFRTPMTPNAVTLLAVLFGVTAGIMFVWGIPHAMVAGGILLWVSAILDGADGILARAKNLQSEFGRALDGAGDAIVAVFTVFPA